ncbi:MAG: hypothetical protein GKS03_02900 [Alphaproteobacteria bacterium]|nr:hypothetical protein [Alphaproteobacteria bacterium]
MLKNEAGIDALKTAMENDYRVFGGPVKLGEKLASFRRASSGLCKVHHVPKFSLKPEEKIYTVGSCFARNVEIALRNLGISLVTDGIVYPYQWVDPRHTQAKKMIEEGNIHLFETRTALNRYSTHSMTYDFDRVFSGTSSLESTTYKLSDDKYWDPQVKNIIQGDIEHTKEVRNILDRNINAAKKSTVIIATLGMTETWFDGETGVILPAAPGPQLIKNNPQRFRFFVANYYDVLENLKRFRKLIDTHIDPTTKIIITTSPIPLGSTFTSKDSIVANSRSKSTLCAAAQDFAEQNELVDYFPSYEMVVNSQYDVWYEDGVHVLAEFVDEIMERFVGLYFG